MPQELKEHFNIYRGMGTPETYALYPNAPNLVYWP
jgi:hypothetical protein